MAAGRQRAEELQRPRKRARLAPEEPERDLDFELVAAWPAARRVAPLSPGPMPQRKAGDARVKCIGHVRKRSHRVNEIMYSYVLQVLRRVKSFVLGARCDNQTQVGRIQSLSH